MSYRYILIAGLLSLLPLLAAADATDLEQRRERLAQKREREFRQADTDNSRSLTREEIVAAHLPELLLSHFDDIDTDHSGALTPEELQAAAQRQLQQQRSAGPRP